MILCMAIIIIAIFAIAICNIDSLDDQENQWAIAEYAEILPEFVLDYIVPASRPNILINQNGYEIDETRWVVFQGDKVPDSYEIVDAQTEQVIFNGTILKEQEETGQFQYGVFTSLQKEGTYYIRAEGIGQSYPFVIEDNRDETLFKESYYATVDKLLNTEDVIEQVEQAVVILCAYEFFPTNFTDDTGIPESGNGIPDILDQLKLVADNLIIKYEKGDAYPEEDAYKVIGFLAKYAFAYEVYEPTAVTQYTRLAQSMWTDTYEEFIPVMSAYFAACELYRTTGVGKYQTILNEYSEYTVHTYDGESIYKLYGDITYLSTNRTVNKNYCQVIMEERIERAIEIAGEKEEDYSFKLADTVDEMLYHTFELLVVDYIVISYEYRTMIANQINYFGGVNTKGTNYIEQLQSDPFYLLIMCDMILDEL